MKAKTTIYTTAAIINNKINMKAVKALVKIGGKKVDWTEITLHNTTRALAVKAKRTLIEDLLKNVAKHEILDHDLGSKYLDQVRAARQPVDTKLILDADLFEFSTL